ncbi:MAG TPA: YggS family pyridoxal phosphate-dependent enzyme [Candidatus Thioglobus sp.]|nr:YggS family pyridoxal phosphate-dependent enzyme [Candidatus Thioglobus sp.]HIL20084.1 YggS family pyridoxal phosphate-dependent enzyme [Candidatus Thioglobus sp.]
MIDESLEKVQSRIDSVSHDQSVQLIAVSKTRNAVELQLAVDAGQQHFGENYLQEALEKIDTLQGQDLIWHFIGPIQSNKTSKIAEHFDWVHSVERVKIAKRLSDQRSESLYDLNILLQVNIDQEATKSGFLLEEIEEIVPQIENLPNISLRGFMCIPSQAHPAQSFSKMANLLAKYPKMDTLSMGMSQDLELAVQNGATFVRIGTDIFGKRDYK